MRLPPRTTALAGVCLTLLAGCTAPPPDAPRTPGPSASASSSARDDATPAPDPTQTPTPPSAACAAPCRSRPRSIGRFRTALAPEASGLAAGVRNPDLLYVLDDGPGTAALLVVR